MTLIQEAALLLLQEGCQQLQLQHIVYDDCDSSNMIMIMIMIKLQGKPIGIVEICDNYYLRSDYKISKYTRIYHFCNPESHLQLLEQMLRSAITSV